ncbi:MFS transporter [Flavobacterium cupreum]|uniref:MFS transporter n=1 Tax=Flavobacterium cupreum TaxID=2133766 RepID=A0A434ADJ4_9FLAO|nr:MFS transporter [Flavobacterium cupreum]RUT72435.1 MFS transporter [Flavobacterium cupreum]
MNTNTDLISNNEKSFAKIMTPIILSVFAVYLTIGMTLGTLPGFVKNDLKFNSFIVGLVIGLQSLATLLTRAYSGKVTDTEGAKTSCRKGILLMVVSGVTYITASLFTSSTLLVLGLLIVARVIHGIAESLAITGALSWGIGLVGTHKSGQVMTWNGIAMYAGIAIGAPAALWLKSSCGMTAVFIIISLLSVAGWLCTVRLPSLPADASHIREPFYKVIGLISVQGLALAFSAIGFACISSFIALLFSDHNWGNPSMAFMAFGFFYILTRVFCSSFPDKFGGYKVAVVSLFVEFAGQLLIGFSPNKTIAIAGCSLTGIGFSLIFPSLGVLAIQKVAPQMRGTALGAFAAFFDLSLALAGPLAGLAAAYYTYRSVYFLGAIGCLLAVGILLANRAKK